MIELTYHSYNKAVKDRFIKKREQVPSISSDRLWSPNKLARVPWLPNISSWRAERESSLFVRPSCACFPFYSTVRNSRVLLLGLFCGPSSLLSCSCLLIRPLGQRDMLITLLPSALCSPLFSFISHYAVHCVLSLMLCCHYVCICVGVFLCVCVSPVIKEGVILVTVCHLCLLSPVYL